MIRKCLNGEMLLKILSSLAQEEVESLSSNVKMGLQMKMKRGELVGFNGCFGYDYHQDTKMITVMKQKQNDLFYTCSLIDYIAKKTKNVRADIVNQLGKERIEKIDDYNSSLYYENPSYIFTCYEENKMI